MDRPKIGIAVIIRKEGKVLLGKRKNSHGEGTWGFPGGHLEYGESFEECARRETAEENGLVIDNVKFSTLTNTVFKESQKHYVTIYMTADYVAGEANVLEPDKCEEWRWFDWNDLPEPLFLPIEHLETGYSPFE